MRVRRLQSLADDDQQWLNEAHAYEKPDGTVRFRCNPMVWEGIGARHNWTLKAHATPLGKIETVISTGQRLRWMEIEEIDGEPVLVELGDNDGSSDGRTWVSGSTTARVTFTKKRDTLNAI